MHESLENATRENARIAEIISYGLRPNLLKALDIREFTEERISLISVRDRRFALANWYEERAHDEAMETYELLQKGVMNKDETNRFNELTDPEREAYKPEIHELPEEAHPPGA